MKRLRRVLASLLMIAIFLSPASGFAAEGLFRVPDFIKEIESEAFLGVDVSGGVFIPGNCTSIAPDAFSNPETLDIYGFSGSAAEAYALHSGAEAVSVLGKGQKGSFLAALGAGAHVDHVGIREIGDVLAGNGDNGDGYAHRFQMAAQHGDVGVLPVQAHGFGIEV